MPDLTFDVDWVDAGRINGPELSATWAALRIRAGDSVITRVLDTRARTVRDFIHVPLYPLAEWLVTNWWFLLHEYANPAKEGDLDFHRRHALRFGREGYAFPDLEMVSSGARTRLRWKRNRPQWSGVEFLDQGTVWVDSGRFREGCATLVDQVIRRLDTLDVGETLLQEEWNAIQSADEEESRFCEIAAGMGWDPYALDDENREWVQDGKGQWILLLAERLGGLLDEAVPAIVPDEYLENWLWISNTIEEAKRFNRLPLERLRSLRDDTPAYGSPETNPWSMGYDIARVLRRTLGLDDDPLPTTARLAEALGEDAESIERTATRQVNLHEWPALVDGVITRSEDESPAFAFRRFRDSAMRFHLCRALAEVLASPGPDMLITRAHTERQQRNRAFAAEFLAPSAGLRSRVSRPVVDDEDIDELALEFGVSSRMIEHQIANHRIARVGNAG